MPEFIYSSIFGELTKNVQIRFDKVSELNKKLFDNVIFEQFLDQARLAALQKSGNDINRNVLFSHLCKSSLLPAEKLRKPVFFQFASDHADAADNLCRAFADLGLLRHEIKVDPAAF